MPTNDTRAEAVEAVAIAMWQAESERAGGRRRLIAWEDENPGQQDNWRSLAQAALAAARAAHFDEAAGIAECAFDDRPRLPEQYLYHDGYRDGCNNAAQAIRTAGSKTDG